MRFSKLFSLTLLTAVALSAADPAIVIKQRLFSQGKEYLQLAVDGEPTSTLQALVDDIDVRLTVLRKASEPDEGCGNLVVKVEPGPGNGNAAVLLTDTAQKCLDTARLDPDKFLAPTVELGPLQYKGTKMLRPTSVVVPNDLQLVEDENGSVVEASKLVFKVVYRPWEGNEKKEYEAATEKDFEDPTRWCVAAKSESKKCATELSIFRKTLYCKQIDRDEPKKNLCFKELKAKLKEKNSSWTEEELDDKIQSIRKNKFGCKDLDMPMSVAKVTYDASGRTLTMMFCRAAFYTRKSAADDFEVLWFGNPEGTAASRATEQSLSLSPESKRMATSFQPRGFLAEKKPSNGIKFQAKNPIAPSGKLFYLETFFRSDRAPFTPMPAVKDFTATTVLRPSLSTRQLYGFRLEGSIPTFSDVPLGSGRKWSMGVTPTYSALFNSGELASDPNSASIQVPLQFSRALADAGCMFTLTDQQPQAKPSDSCASPKFLRRVIIRLPGVLESSKNGTTKNILFSPSLGLQSRPVDAFGIRVSLSGATGFEIGKRLTEVKLPGDTAAMERPDGLRRFFVAPTLAFTPTGVNKVTGSVEYKFVQLFRDEVHQSPADVTVFVGDSVRCAASPKDSCVIGPKDGVIKNFAKGSRQWVNAQVSFDLTEQLAVVAGYRRGRLAPLYVYTNQFAIGIAFHLDPKAKPTLPFKK